MKELDGAAADDGAFDVQPRLALRHGAARKLAIQRAARNDDGQRAARPTRRAARAPAASPSRTRRDGRRLTSRTASRSSFSCLFPSVSSNTRRPDACGGNSTGAHDAARVAHGERVDVVLHDHEPTAEAPQRRCRADVRRQAVDAALVRERHRARRASPRRPASYRATRCSRRMATAPAICQNLRPWDVSSKFESTRCLRAGTAWPSSSRAFPRKSSWPSRRAGRIRTATPRCAAPWRTRGRSTCRRTRSSRRSNAPLGKDATNYEQIIYEGYAPHGVAVIVECATDNPTRTVASVRAIFSKSGGNLGSTGSVAFQFRKMGVFRLNPEGIDHDDLELYLIDHGLEEMGDSTGEKGEPQIVARCLFADFGQMQEALEKRGITPLSATHEYICTAPVELPEADGERGARDDRQARAGRGRPERLPLAHLAELRSAQTGASARRDRETALTARARSASVKSRATASARDITRVSSAQQPREL